MTRRTENPSSACTTVAPGLPIGTSPAPIGPVGPAGRPSAMASGSQ